MGILSQEFKYNIFRNCSALKIVEMCFLWWRLERGFWQWHYNKWCDSQWVLDQSPTLLNACTCSADGYIREVIIRAGLTLCSHGADN